MEERRNEFKPVISGGEIIRREGSCSKRNSWSVHGIPTRCWCGSGITTYISKTKKNPFREFYRCKVALQRIGENHLFKWVDEACNEEFLMEKARQRTLEEKTTDKFEEEATDNLEDEEAVKDEASKDNGCLGVISLICSKFW